MFMARGNWLRTTMIAAVAIAMWATTASALCQICHNRRGCVAVMYGYMGCTHILGDGFVFECIPSGGECGVAEPPGGGGGQFPTKGGPADQLVTTVLISAPAGAREAVLKGATHRVVKASGASGAKSAIAQLSEFAGVSDFQPVAAMVDVGPLVATDFKTSANKGISMVARAAGDRVSLALGKPGSSLELEASLDIGELLIVPADVGAGDYLAAIRVVSANAVGADGISKAMEEFHKDVEAYRGPWATPVGLKATPSSHVPVTGPTWGQLKSIYR